MARKTKADIEAETEEQERFKLLQEKRAERDPSLMHEHFSEYIKEQTGVDVSPKAVMLVTSMRKEFQRSEAYGVYEEAKEAEKAAALEKREAARAEAKAKRDAEKAKAKAEEEEEGAKKPVTRKTAAKKATTTRKTKKAAEAEDDPFDEGDDE